MSQHLSTCNISSKSMHAFLSNLVNKQTNEQGQKQLPPRSFVGGNEWSIPVGPVASSHCHLSSVVAYMGLHVSLPSSMWLSLLVTPCCQLKRFYVDICVVVRRLHVDPELLHFVNVSYTYSVNLSVACWYVLLVFEFCSVLFIWDRWFNGNYRHDHWQR